MVLNVSFPQRWPLVYGGPAGEGKIRVTADDFSVNESLSFVPDGSGEHVFLQIEKRHENTDYVAARLARFSGIARRDVGYAGMKDRHARTTQWFSVWLPGKEEPDWTAFNTDTITVLQAMRHGKKLRTGALSRNAFQIAVRDWCGDRVILEKQLHSIKAQGIANYFGEQRFGHGGENVAKALAMFRGQRVKREQRSLYLSAARSYLFNRILALRIEQHCWNRALPGDALMLDGSHSFFKCEIPDADIEQRVAAGKLHPTGRLWGKGRIEVSGMALALEEQLVAAYPELARGLENAGVDGERRALRVNVADLQWEFVAANDLLLRFSLPAGSYATALLREVAALEDHSGTPPSLRPETGVLP
ncbi:MAG: tRNA pseudouridine(13) synthase TruD [Gammaproteobacteria bacterium]